MRILTNGFILVLADIIGITIGALAAWSLTGSAHQVWLQLPVAVIVTVSIFMIWRIIVRKVTSGKFLIIDPTELSQCLIVSIVIMPLLFVPIHYITQGYLTSLGNLIALAVYQLFVNAIAIYAPVILGNQSAEQNKTVIGS